jgi:pimeloyl-ACP methyl ester carboxylesterase
MTAAADPARVAAIVTSGAGDPRPEEPSEASLGEMEMVRQGGMSALLDEMRVAYGERFNRECPPWFQAIVMRADPDAFVAGCSKMWVDGITDDELPSFPVPALLIAGELEDKDDVTAKIAEMIPNGQRLRLQGLGHEGTCNASLLTIPIARAFLGRWFTS